MVFGSLVELHVGLHSCLCFSLLEKLLLRASSTPPRHLLDTLLSIELLKLFHIAISITSRYLVDRSRNLLPPRQLLDSWWIDRTSALASNGLFLNTSSIPVSIDDHFLDTFLNSCLNTSRHLHLLRFTEGLQNLLMRSAAHFLRFLSRQLSLFLSQTLLSHFNLDPQGFFKLFQDFPHLVNFLSPIIHAFHVLKPRFWGF